MATFKADWPSSENEFRVTGQPPKVSNGIISEFGKGTSIHGIRHFTNKRNHILERIVWASILIVSVFVCFNLLINVWVRWSEGPIFVGLADETESIRNVPFPAVTICPETKAKKNIFNYTEAYHLAGNRSLDALNVTRLEAISQICDAHLAAGIINTTGNFIDDAILRELEELAPTSSEVLFFCKWRNNPQICQTYFHRIWTDEGLCFTFNLLDSNELFSPSWASEAKLINRVVPVNGTAPRATWSLANGYDHTQFQDAESDTAYPHHTYGAGLRGGLTVLLRLYDYDVDYMCRGPVQGFKVLLHLPNELPQISSQYFRVPLNKETFVSISPRVTTTANSLRGHTPEVRGCYYNYERPLKYFKEYTQSNCELECLANLTTNKCGCVKFSMPHESDTPICGPAKMSCYNDAADELLKFDGYASGQHPDATNDCKCLPACTSISYDHEISQADFDYRSLFVAFKNPLTEFPGMVNSRLTITFKSNNFVALKRHELYNHVDLLAICGGILALFFGASLLSFVEFMHFFSSKLLCRSDRRFGVEEHILNDQEH